MVTVGDVREAFAALGIGEGDTVLVHSSLRSMGELENGPATIIDGIFSRIGRDGTLLMPTLSMVDFPNSRKTWYRDKPSDTGYLSEYFRKQPYVYRSDSPTHSVAARGRLAYEYTREHEERGPHICALGDGAFADSSPWSKLYRNDAFLVFIGVDMSCNTMKHLVESRFIEALLACVSDEERAAALRSRLRRFETFDEGGLWPFYDSGKMEAVLARAGLVAYTRLGQATLRAVHAKASSDMALFLLQNEPEKWCDADMLAWIGACKKG